MMEKDEKTEQMHFDRIAGYGILLVLFLIILGTIGYGIYYSRSPEPVRVISFDTIGNLRIDDPVTLKGLNIGKIVKITWRPHSVLVFIQTHAKLTLHPGYTILNKDVGFMGDRTLCIEDDNINAAAIAPADTLIGEFRSGVSEGVGMIWKLRGAVDSFTKVSSRLLQGSASHPSFVRQMHTVIGSADSATGKLLSMVSLLEGGISPKLDSLTALVNTVSALVQSAAWKTPGAVAGVERMCLTLEKSLNQADSLTLRALTLVRVVDTVAASDHLGVFRKKIDMLHEAIVHLKDRFIQLKISL